MKHYIIQKAQKRTVFIKKHQDDDSSNPYDLPIKFFLQFPKILFTIDISCTPATYCKQKTRKQTIIKPSRFKTNSLLFHTQFIIGEKNIQDSKELLVYTSPLGNSTIETTCLGTRTEKYYKRKSFESKELLINDIIAKFWTTTFDYSYSVFTNPETKFNALIKWEKNTKKNKPFKYVFDGLDYREDEYSGHLCETTTIHNSGITEL